MANRAKLANLLNHKRQGMYKAKGVTMIPTKREERIIVAALMRKRAGEID